MEHRMDAHRETLRLALRVAIAALVAAVLPIWPYGLYTLLRLVVTGVALFALVVLGTNDSKRTIRLVAVALVFNPLVPVHLSRMTWIPIDLGVAYGFWRMINGALAVKAATNDESSPPSESPAVSQDIAPDRQPPGARERGDPADGIPDR